MMLLLLNSLRYDATLYRSFWLVPVRYVCPDDEEREKEGGGGGPSETFNILRFPSSDDADMCAETREIHREPLHTQNILYLAPSIFVCDSFSSLQNDISSEQSGKSCVVTK